MLNLNLSNVASGNCKFTWGVSEVNYTHEGKENDCSDEAHTLSLSIHHMDGRLFGTHTFLGSSHLTHAVAMASVEYMLYCQLYL